MAYSQRQLPWGPTIFGLNTDKTATYAGFACLCTSLSNMLTANGVATTPKQVNDMLISLGGFVPGTGIMYWIAPPKLNAAIQDHGFNASLQQVNQWLVTPNNWAIIEVKAPGQHFVLGSAANTIIDAIDGRTKNILTYPFVRARLYSWTTSGKGGWIPITTTTTANGDPLMKPEEEANAYRILFNRPDEAPNSTPRSGYQMIVEAEPELINKRATMAADLAIAQQQAIDANKRAADDKEFAKELKQERDDLEAKVKELTTPQAPDPLLALKASEVVHEISRVTIAPGEMVDYGGTGGVPSYTINAGTHFKQHSTFAVDGVRYVRTEKSADTGQWYGTPESLFDPVEAPVVNQTKVDAAHLAASSLVATIGRFLYSKFTKH